MHILREKKKTEYPDVQIMPAVEETRYDFLSALAKTVLIFILVYGAIGGFLSAYDIEYNSTICIISIFACALILCFAYEIHRKWCSYVTAVAMLFIYAYVAFKNYWTINSGFYSIVNHVNEASRSYLNVVDGTEYVLRVSEEYTAVTMFVIFVGIFGVILFNIRFQSKINLLQTVFWTFMPYLVPLYFGKTPKLIYIIFLLTGYITAVMLKCTGVSESLTLKMRQILPSAAVIVLLIVSIFNISWLKNGYNKVVKENTLKLSTENKMVNLVQFGMMALFSTSSNGAGIDGGMLSRSTAAIPDFETDLIVRFTPYSYDTVYLKAYTGKDYDGYRWSAAENDAPDDGLMKNTVMARKKSFDADKSIHGKGVMEVENIGASEKYEYRPYYTDIGQSESGKTCVYTYYPAVGEINIGLNLDLDSDLNIDSDSIGLVDNEIDSAYLNVPAMCYDAVEKICGKAGFKGTPEEIADSMIRYFDDNYSYTLRPGFMFGYEDYITHFLTSSKKGYCEHFASAGTMILRYMGIPARYAEGYVIPYYDVVNSGNLADGLKYEDYYSGYSPIGETAPVEIEIPDAKAHAWVEAYIDGKGWIVVDPTPAITEEETSSFWDVFVNGRNDSDSAEIGQGNLNSYLEAMIDNAAKVIIIAAVISFLIFCCIMSMRYYKLSRLSGSERVYHEYKRLDKYIASRNSDYASLATIQEQMDFVETHYSVPIPAEYKEKLYQIFFAENTACTNKSEIDYEEIYKFLIKCRIKVSFKEGESIMGKTGERSHK